MILFQTIIQDCDHNTQSWISIFPSPTHIHVTFSTSILQQYHQCRLHVYIHQQSLFLRWEKSLQCHVRSDFAKIVSRVFQNFFPETYKGTLRSPHVRSDFAKIVGHVFQNFFPLTYKGTPRSPPPYGNFAHGTTQVASDRNTPTCAVSIAKDIQTNRKTPEFLTLVFGFWKVGNPGWHNIAFVHHLCIYHTCTTLTSNKMLYTT